MHIKYRKTCRVCGSKSLTKVISLDQQNLQGSFVKPEKELPPLRKISTQLVRCDPTKDENACGLLQTQTSVPTEILYSVYWYKSGTNNTMRNHLRGIVDSAVDLIDNPTATVLDIGCNDGTLLKCYPSKYKKFGIDPSDVAQEVEEGIKVIQDTFPSEELNSVVQEEKFDIITSIAMFYDLEDPVAFVVNLKNHLSKDGIWIVEMSYMPTMLKNNSYDTICHEHLEYYSLAVLENIFFRAGMKIFKVELNSINGGSIRCYVTHMENYKYKDKEDLKAIAALRIEEFDLQLDTDKPYRDFQERINVHKEKLSSMLRKLKSEGKTIHIYGASTKGNTILQWCGIDKFIIDYAAERNPDKYGAKTIGTDIPIISEAESRAMKPDYYLILPWHFKKEFLEREKEILQSGTKMIFPLPEVKIYDINS